MSQTYKERGLPGVQDRDIPLYTGVLIDEEHTLSEYLFLYRQGKLSPLRYEFNGVPIVCCRGCLDPRPDDGTPCQFCGVYQQRCAPNNQDAVSRACEALRHARMQSGVPKQVNPRRRTCHGRC